MHELSIKVLLAISAFLGVQPLPDTPDNPWVVVSGWTQYENGYELVLKSEKIVEECKNAPNHFISFPPVVHGAHEVSADGHVVKRFGDFTFQEVRSFYGTIDLPCKVLANSKVIKWKVASYSRYFSRLPFYPKVVRERPISNLFLEVLNAVAGGSLVLLGLFSLVIFYGKVSHSVAFSLAFSCFSWSFYFIGNVIGFFGITVDMLTMHRIADLGIHFGTALYIFSMYTQQLINRSLFVGYLFTSLVAMTILILGDTGDVLQFGTTLPFGIAIAVFSGATIKLARRVYENKYGITSWLQLISLIFFFGSILNDIFSVIGLTNSYVLLSVGVLGGLLVFALGVNYSINEAYKERDYLRHNLEDEVKRKTHALEQAMLELKSTQSELIQSAKLASLGTLSAGIAHEINNALNYVNGAVRPLEKIMAKVDVKDQGNKITALLSSMKEGLSLTFDIISSLKNYTGLDQAKFDDVQLKRAVNSVLTILKNRTRENINVEVDIPEDLFVTGSLVGLNQIFMNLIGNAVDAMPDGGNLRISAQENESDLEVKITDTGEGIPQEKVDRIFEPFFTTKDVGKGTGLGLHIVKMEMDKHGGKVEVHSQIGSGTEFKLFFPKRIQQEVAA